MPSSTILEILVASCRWNRSKRRAKPPSTPKIEPTDPPLAPLAPVTSLIVPPQFPYEPIPDAARTTVPLSDTAHTVEPPSQQAPQILCGSSNNSFGSLSITTVQGNMFMQNDDYVNEIRRVIAAEMRRSIPAMVRHSNENALVLTDALGETLTLPWSIVPTYEELRRLLVNHFRGKLGEQRVAAGRYCIGRVDESEDGLVVNAEHWENLRNERGELVMSMVIEQKYDRDLKRMCPKCGKTELGTYVDQGWHVCRRCNTRFILPGRITHRRARAAQVDDPVEVSQFRHVQKQYLVVHCKGRPP
ncbi:hypothetical protein DFP72DRAFT_642201 [Ephemerocybe angulata]|uniref:Ubiquitin-like domain-containing protein n=1 Tax=Ephemerocybe angulata TaxID=980116 RepID=A0A8H6LX10_9AGAR|nr:hypothetical protein DFP72DRAFT_642201 [Tulosesus angulatus]